MRQKRDHEDAAPPGEHLLRVVLDALPVGVLRGEAPQRPARRVDGHARSGFQERPEQGAPNRGRA